MGCKAVRISLTEPGWRALRKAFWLVSFIFVFLRFSGLHGSADVAITTRTVAKLESGSLLTSCRSSL